MIYQYEVISPVIDKSLPFFNKKTGRLFCVLKGSNYRYYVECARYNSFTGCREYFLLLSATKFDNNCRKCYVDCYGRLQVTLHGELKDYVADEATTRGNLSFEYLESKNEYDVFQIS